jgi:hypothetical protein
MGLDIEMEVARSNIFDYFEYFAMKQDLWLLCQVLADSNQIETWNLCSWRDKMYIHILTSIENFDLTF